MVQRDDLLKGHFSEFRLTWIPVIKSLLSTAVDVGSDWAYYFRTKPGDEFDNYEVAILTIAIISSILAVLTLLQIFNEVTNCCTANKRPGYIGFSRAVTVLLGLEMIIEDIPMFVIVTMITNEKNDGEWTSIATLKLFASSFNFAFNLLDMLMPVVDAKIIEDGGQDDNDESGVDV